MKQIIVMIAMIMLGIAIAGFVGQFKTSADNISHSTNDRVNSFITSSGLSN